MKDSIYSRNPEKWDLIAENGSPSLAEVARRFDNNRLMDLALGYVHASSKWGNNADAMPSDRAERSARLWLAENTGPTPCEKEPDTDLLSSLMNDAPTCEPVPESATIVMDVAREPDVNAVTLVIICPSDKAMKITKIAHLIGADVTTI